MHKRYSLLIIAIVFCLAAEAGLSQNRIPVQPETAFKDLYRSLILSEQQADYVWMTAVLNEIGELFLELDNPEEGIHYLEEAKGLSKELDLPEMLRKAYINLGIASREKGDYEAAGYYLNEATSITTPRDPVTLLKIDYHLGVLNLNLGETGNAREYFINSLAVSRQEENSEGIYHSSIGMGDLNRELGRSREARNWYQAAVEESRLMNAGNLLEQALEKLYREYRESGELDAALETLESIRLHIDTARTRDYERSRAEYETLFESRRQAQENRLLTAERAEQQARIQLQKGLGVSALFILAILLAVTFILYGNMRAREKLNLSLLEKNQDISIKNRELDQLNRVKDKMFAVIAHDLRGPLSSLKGLLYLIREKKLTGATLDKLANSLEQSLRSNSATMENLLAWSKSQMSGLNLNIAEFVLGEALEDVHGQVNYLLEKKGVDFTSDFCPGLRVSGDYDAVKLILRNLLSNAVKFCESGDSISVIARQEPEHTLISIQDTGVGIRKEDQNKIFADTHFTSQGTKSETGNGLGLSLCREFVEKHGGKIWFESTRGEGTVFFFTLPHPRRELIREVAVPQA